MVKKIVDAFSISGYNRRTEDGRLSICFLMTTTHTTDASGTHGKSGQKMPQDHLHFSRKRRKRLKINTNHGFWFVRIREVEGSNPFGSTIMWRQKRCLLRKAWLYRAFLLPKRRFFSVPKRRCKIAVFPLWIDLNSRKVNIRYTGR